MDSFTALKHQKDIFILQKLEEHGVKSMKQQVTHKDLQILPSSNEEIRDFYALSLIISWLCGFLIMQKLPLATQNQLWIGYGQFSFSFRLSPVKQSKVFLPECPFPHADVSTELTRLQKDF